jgi:hypothetical protein
MTVMMRRRRGVVKPIYLIQLRQWLKLDKQPIIKLLGCCIYEQLV